MKVLYVLICSAFIPCRCLAQQVEGVVDSQPLIDFIPRIEDYYAIKFSFADKLIAQKEVSLQPGPDKEGFLRQLEKQIGLRMEQVKDDYFVIRPFVAADRVSICGYARDAQSQPVAGAVVLTRSTNTGYVTDSTGFFEINGIPWGSVISINHLGYAVRRVRIAELFQPGCREVFLTETPEVLSEVVIRDFLSAGISKIDQSLEILPQELKILPGLIEPDILQSIQQAPGVNSPFETASGIFVRGGSPDQNLVKWNGIKTYSQGHFFGMLSSFNPYITKEVRFIKNGTSARYGDRVSGVIDITSGDEVAQKISGGAGLNMIYGDAYLDLPMVTDKLSLQLSGRRSFNDHVETFTYEQFSDRVFQNTKISEEAGSGGNASKNDFFFHDFSSRIIFKPGEHNQLTLNALLNKNDLDFSDQDQDRRFNDVLRTENEGYNLSWRQRHSGFQWEMDAYFSRYLLDYEFKSTENDTTDIASKKNFISDFGLDLAVSLPLSAHSTISSGYQFSRNNVRYAFETQTPSYSLILDEDDSELTTHAIFTEYQLRTDKTRLTAGVRFNNYNDLDENYLEPRMTFQQQLTDGWRLNVSGEYRSQTVSQIKESVVSDLSLENQVWTLSSADRFPVIDSYQLTSGFSFDKGGWLIDVEAYLKRIRSITTLTFGFLNPVDNEFRKGNSQIRGLDFFVRRQINAYKTWLGYSYLFTENDFSGLNNDEPFPGNWNIEHTVKWSHFYTLKNLELSLGWYWHTGKSFTNVVEGSPESGPVTVEFDGINQDNLPLYHRLDFSAVYEFFLSRNKNVRYRVGLSVLNIYDRKNLLNREFRTTPSLENELIDTRVYSLGITPNFVFRVFW